MKRFDVLITATAAVKQSHTVEAENEEEAKKKVLDMARNYIWQVNGILDDPPMEITECIETE